MRINRLAAVGVMVLASLAGSVRADGTTDLNLDPAATTTIATSGSYRLVADVTMTANVNALAINATNVTLDLNGHTITGTGVTAGDGIVGSGTNVTILNGTVTAFFAEGIDPTGSAWTVRTVNATGNRGWGIDLLTGSLVEDSKATGNNIGGGAGGIRVGASSTVRRCVASDNDSTGNTTGSATGISAGADCVITDNRCLGNGAGSVSSAARGIDVTGARCLISGNISSSNTSPGGACYGIDVDSDGHTIVNNVCNANTGATSVRGIITDSLSAGCKISGNTCSGNALTASGGTTATGIEAGTGCEISGNTCHGNSAAPATAGSAMGIVTAGDNCTIADNTCTGQRGGGTGVGRGIFTAGDNHIIINNIANDNDAGANGMGAFGIFCLSYSRVIGNTCIGNNEGSAVSGTSYGIFNNGQGTRIEDNVCSGNNSDGDGNAVGIRAGATATVRGNSCDSNTSTVDSYGIQVVGTSTHIEQNSCRVNTGATAYGIYIDATGVIVIGNKTGYNSTAGIAWSAGGITGRSELNRMDEGAIVNPPTSIGGSTGDVVF